MPNSFFNTIPKVLSYCCIFAFNSLCWDWGTKIDFRKVCDKFSHKRNDHHEHKYQQNNAPLGLLWTFGGARRNNHFNFPFANFVWLAGMPYPLALLSHAEPMNSSYDVLPMDILHPRNFFTLFFISLSPFSILCAAPSSNDYFDPFWPFVSSAIGFSVGGLCSCTWSSHDCSRQAYRLFSRLRRPSSTCMSFVFCSIRRCSMLSSSSRAKSFSA